MRTGCSQKDLRATICSTMQQIVAKHGELSLTNAVTYLHCMHCAHRSICSPGILVAQTVQNMSGLLAPRSKMNLGIASLTPWTTTSSLTSTKTIVATDETIRHGWAMNHMKSITSSVKEMIAARSTSQQCPIAQMKIQSRPVFIGQATKTTTPTLIQCPSYTIIPSIQIWQQIPASMGKCSLT